MSVTLLTAPPALSFSADLISAKFACTGYLQQVGVKSENELDLTATPPSSVLIRYGNKSVTMTGTIGSVTDDGIHYDKGSAALALEGFKSNYTLSSDFDITLVGTKLIFTAKTKSLGFDFKNSPGEGTNTVAGLPAIKQPNYTVLFKLFLENEANTAFDLIYTTNLQLLPGTDGQAEAMIGDKIHAVISKAIRASLPEQPNASVIQCKNSCRRYYFEFAESYGEPITVKKLNTSGIFTALHGGLSSIAQSQTTALNLLAPSTTDNDQFLKQGAKTILTRTNQPQFLYFFNSRTSKTVSVKSIFTFTDGTVHAETIAGISLESYRKYAFDASFLFLYATPVSSKIVASYTVYLLNGADRVSEIRTFILDYARRNQIRYFLNWSSFGAIDTRLCYGKGESEFELSNNIAERIAGVGENIMFGKSLTFDSTLKRSFKVATGFIGRQELQHNADFFLSNLKYRFSKNLNLPITIPSGKIAEVKDGDLLLAQVFEYSYSFADHAYTEGDAEDTGFGMDGFYFNSGGGFIPAPGGGGSGGTGGPETDPTVGAWIKAITPADIARWNATVGITFGNWIDVDAIASQINYQALRLQYKTDAPSDADKVITYIAGYFSLDPAFVGTTLLIGKLPAGNRPQNTLKEWFSVGTTELFLVIATNGDISIESKDGFDLPTGSTDDVKYFINLNYKPKTALIVYAGKWVVDSAGSYCDPGTGNQINLQLKRVTDDVLELPLDINNNLSSASGLYQKTMPTPMDDPRYTIYNPAVCAIAPGKWIIDITYKRCDPTNPGYLIYERMLRVADNVGEAPYDVNDKHCTATGLPQATAPTPTDKAGYTELNTTLCPIGGGGGGGGGGADVNFTLAQYGRRLRLNGPVAITCNISCTVSYYNVKRDIDGIEISRGTLQTDTLTLIAGANSVASPSSISSGPYDTLDIQSFTFSPKFCGTNQVFVNGQEGVDLGGGIII